MSNFRDLSTIALVLLFAVFLQLIFVSAELKETPDRAAVAFAKAYYRLDPDMADRVCREVIENGDPVDTLIYNSATEAKQRGFGPAYMKSQLFKVRTSILEQNEATAQVNLVWERKKAIHPAFAYFAKMWDIGKTYHEEKNIDLVLEEGKWKVCGENIFNRL